MANELMSLGVLFLCATIGGIVSARFKQPAVFGLLLMGAVIGPNFLNLVQDVNTITIMAEFGAILLLFVVGLDFDASKLIKIGPRSILIGLLKFAFVFFLGYEITLLLGLTTKVALFIGLILSFSSTVVIIKVLEQKEMINRTEVPLLIAILIIEDIIAILALTFLSGIKSADLTTAIEHIVFSIAILTFSYYLIGNVLRFCVSIILNNNSDDSVFTFLSLAIGALFSYFASFLGLTPSSGAFLAGSMIASLPNSKEYRKAIQPYALIFTSIFFISMGTLVDFKAVESNLFLILISLFIVLISRFIVIGFSTFLLANFRREQPIFSSIAMISIGEFSLLIAKESGKFGVEIDLVTVTSAIIFISAIMMSLSMSYSETIYSKLKTKISLRTRFKFENIAYYMRRFFDQLEIENYSTKKIKSESKLALMLTLILLFSFLILRKIAFLISNYASSVWYTFYGLSAILLLYLTTIIYKRLEIIHSMLSIVLTNVDRSKNIKKCKLILNYLLIILFLLFLSMLFPLVIFAFDLSGLTNIIPIVLIIIVAYPIKNFYLLINTDQTKNKILFMG